MRMVVVIRVTMLLMRRPPPSSSSDGHGVEVMIGLHRSREAISSSRRDTHHFEWRERGKAKRKVL